MSYDEDTLIEQPAINLFKGMDCDVLKEYKVPLVATNIYAKNNEG